MQSITLFDPAPKNLLRKNCSGAALQVTLGSFIENGVLELLVSRKMPKLSRHLAKAGWTLPSFTQGWYWTAFTSYLQPEVQRQTSMCKQYSCCRDSGIQLSVAVIAVIARPLDCLIFFNPHPRISQPTGTCVPSPISQVTARVWDAIQSEGIKAMHRVSLALLQRYESTIMGAASLEAAVNALNQRLLAICDKDDLLRVSAVVMEGGDALLGSGRELQSVRQLIE